MEEASGRTAQMQPRLELWISQGAWVWRLFDSRRDGGIVGATASKAEATREARAALEKLLTGLECAPALLAPPKCGGASLTAIIGPLTLPAVRQPSRNDGRHPRNSERTFGR